MRAVATAALLVLLAGCATSAAGAQRGATGVDASTPVDATGTDASAPTARVAGQHVLHLYVGNQSFAEPQVDLTVTVDGRQVVADRFAVEGQHTWVEYPLALAPGAHVLVATAGGGEDGGEGGREGVGAPLEYAFVLDGERWAVLDHWASVDAGQPSPFTFELFDGPVGFA